jgi:hypothetical protein
MHYLLIDQKALLFEQKIFVLEALRCLLVLSQLTTEVCELAHFTFFLLIWRCSCILVQVLLHKLNAGSCSLHILCSGVRSENVASVNAFSVRTKRVPSILCLLGSTVQARRCRLVLFSLSLSLARSLARSRALSLELSWGLYGRTSRKRTKRNVDPSDT